MPPHNLSISTPTESNLGRRDLHPKIDRADRLFRYLMYAASGVSVAILLLMGWVITEQAMPALKQFGLGFLVSREWNVPDLQFGALPLIYGTLGSGLISLLFAIPVGLAVAIVTSEELLPHWLRSIIAFTIELLAAIPSVIFGLWGFYTFIPLILPVQQFLFAKFGTVVPLFSTEPSGSGLLTAGILLGIMILPTLAAVSREVLLVVPGYLRTGSMALGATRWETIFRVVLPKAFSGIVGGVMLALGRALGETMAVTMVIGNAENISPSVFSPAYSIPAILANTFAEAQEEVHIGALTYLVLILFTITLLVNIGALALVRLVERQEKS
ncbi:phosphate ABC transporter permease subunit PstC [Chamaesiphon sp. OTE_8_metabat_110]|uniref:phosphate ABC transporter permease subunit PstC n=1 Tax=Chamaesiphon sp. OTE_8_metabat_110 TaxID=2964696 RepID=UPI00286BAC57|nr:phosphate ABC transporter permease subunit PstC [Chamaesiphon sp. OTE_8_metabat_110]